MSNPRCSKCDYYGHKYYECDEINNIKTEFYITKEQLNFLEDYFEMTKYAMWFNDIGEKKANEIANQIHSGKYGSNAGVHVQMNKLLHKIEKSQK